MGKAAGNQQRVSLDLEADAMAAQDERFRDLAAFAGLVLGGGIKLFEPVVTSCGPVILPGVFTGRLGCDGWCGHSLLLPICVPKLLIRRINLTRISTIAQPLPNKKPPPRGGSGFGLAGFTWQVWSENVHYFSYHYTPPNGGLFLWLETTLDFSQPYRCVRKLADRLIGVRVNFYSLY